jgi:hypothetical protein
MVVVVVAAATAMAAAVLVTEWRDDYIRWNRKPLCNKYDIMKST